MLGRLFFEIVSFIENKFTFTQPDAQPSCFFLSLAHPPPPPPPKKKFQACKTSLLNFKQGHGRIKGRYDLI